MSDQSYDFVHQVDLQTLSKLRSDAGPIFSLYLDLQAGGSPRDRFNALLDQAAQQKKLDQQPAAYQEQWRKEAERVRRWLEAGGNPAGGHSAVQSIAVISGTSADLWRTYSLPVKVLDRLVASDQPYVRPLEILAEEFNCTLVVMLDEGSTRLIEVNLGQANEVDHMQAVPVTGSNMQDGIRDVADRVQAVWQEHDCDQLLIGGSDEMTGPLLDLLVKSQSGEVVEELHIPPQAGLEEILAEVLAIEAERERNIEVQRVETLIASAEGSAAVFGLEQTLLSMRPEKVKKIRLLVVEDGFHQAGGECPSCGFLDDETEEVCMLCGMALRQEPDIIEVALKRVLDAGGEIDILRSQEARRALEPHGRIGILIDDPQALPPEKDSASHLPIDKDGKIKPQLKRDETVEESFPASDPPGGW